MKQRMIKSWLPAAASMTLIACALGTLAGCVENKAYIDDGYYSSGSGYATYNSDNVTSGYNRDFQANNGYSSTGPSTQHVQPGAGGGYHSSNNKAKSPTYRTNPNVPPANDGYGSSSSSDRLASQPPGNGYYSDDPKNNPSNPGFGTGNSGYSSSAI